MSSPQPDSLQPKRKNLLPLIIFGSAIGLAAVGIYDYSSGGKLGATTYLQTLFAKPMTAEQTAKLKELEDQLGKLQLNREELATKIGKPPSNSAGTSASSDSDPAPPQAANSETEAKAEPESTAKPAAAEVNFSAPQAEKSEPQPTEKQP